jgi:hypothetical protein
MVKQFLRKRRKGLLRLQTQDLEKNKEEKQSKTPF